MALDIKPTRSELINLKRRIKQTKNGYKLLKMKRDGLFHEFRTLLSDMIKAKRELNRGLRSCKISHRFGKLHRRRSKGPLRSNRKLCFS